jgi:hypothetical protein
MNRYAQRGELATRLFILLLFTTNLLMVALIYLHVSGPTPTPSVIKVAPCEHSPHTAISPNIDVNMQAISGALVSICRSLETLSEDVARINVTGVQYAYLTRETERLERASELVTLRIQTLEAEARSKGRSGGDPANMNKLREIKDKLNQETGQRNQLLKQLVQKLEERFGNEKPDDKKSGAAGPPSAPPGIPPSQPSGAKLERPGQVFPPETTPSN